MTAEIVNLNKVRKARERANRERDAQENRIKYGQTKSERNLFEARTRKWHFIWLPALVGLSIEGLQLVISLLLGYPYRVIDVNDLIANAAGVLLGYAFFRVFRWAFLELARGARFKPGGWLAYLLEVASRS